MFSGDANIISLSVILKRKSQSSYQNGERNGSEWSSLTTKKLVLTLTVFFFNFYGINLFHKKIP